MRVNVAAHAVESVAVRELAADVKQVNGDLSMVFSIGRSVAVVPSIDADHERLHAQAENEVRDGDQRIAYLFTWSSQGIEPEVAALWPGWSVQPLPAELRSLASTRTLFDDGESPRDRENGRR
jgi:hypothetical protein